MKKTTPTKKVTSASWSVLPPEERTRREERATLLRDRLSHVPHYAKASALDGDEYWARFYDSRVKS